MNDDVKSCRKFAYLPGFPEAAFLALAAGGSAATNECDLVDEASDTRSLHSASFFNFFTSRSGDLVTGM